MVELGEGVDEQLPVAAYVGPVLVDLGHLFERIAGQPPAELAEVVAEPRLVVRIQVHEDEPLPDLRLHGYQAELVAVEVEELRFLLHEGHRTVQCVAPSVVLTGELPAGAARLLLRVVVPDELVPPVAADVVEAPDDAVGAADHDHGGPGGIELLREITAGPRQLLHPPDVEPRPGEDGLAFELVVLRRDRVLVGDRPRAEVRVVLGPAPLGGLREMAHRGAPVLRGETSGSDPIATTSSLPDRSASSSTPKDRKAMARVS